MKSIWQHDPGPTLRALAQYLGTTEEGHAQWLIEGQTYTGSVSTFGGGVPLIGREYPAWCNDPDNRSQWVVLVRSSSKILPKDFETPPTPTQDWICWGASFARNWAWTAVNFDPTSVTTSGNVPTLNPRTNLRLEDHQDPVSTAQASYYAGVYRVGVTNLGGLISAPTAAMVGPLGLNNTRTLRDTINTYEAGQSEGWSFATIAMTATAFSDGLHFVDCQGTFTDTEFDEDYWVHWTVAIRLTSSNADAVQWVQRIYVSGPGDSAPNIESILTPTRCAVVVGSNPFQVRHRDKFTGGDAKTISSDTHLGLSVFDPIANLEAPPSTIGGTRFRGDFRGIFAREERLYLSDSENGDVCCIDLSVAPSAASLVWVTSSSSDKRKVVIGLTDTSLICWAEQTIQHTYTDRSVNRVAGEADTEASGPRIARAEGHSKKRGILGLLLTTGAELTFSVFPGTEADGTVLGDQFEAAETYERIISPFPKSEMWIFGVPPGGSSPEWYTVPISPPYLTGWDAFLFPRYHNAHDIVREDPADFDADPFVLDIPVVSGVNYPVAAPGDGSAPEQQPDIDYRNIQQYGSASDLGTMTPAPGSFRHHCLEEARILNRMREQSAAGNYPVSDSLRLEWPVHGVFEALGPLPQATGPTEASPDWESLSFVSTLSMDTINALPHYQQIQWLGLHRTQGSPPTEEDPADGSHDYLLLDQLFPHVPHHLRTPPARPRPWFEEVAADPEYAEAYASSNSTVEEEHVFRAAAAESWTITRKVVYRTQEALELLRTPLPNNTVGPTASTGNRVILPPWPRSNVETHDIVWRAYKPSGALAWTSAALAITGAVEVGPTIATGAGIHTFVREGSFAAGRCITLSAATGEFLSDVSCPLTLVQTGAIFDGYRLQFVNTAGSTRWGQP